jgi:hypothetical protein
MGWGGVWGKLWGGHHVGEGTNANPWVGGGLALWKAQVAGTLLWGCEKGPVLKDQQGIEMTPLHSAAGSGLVSG